MSHPETLTTTVVPLGPAMARPEIVPPETKSVQAFDLSRVLHKLLLIIPIGVMGNIAFSWFITDHDKISALVNFKPAYLWLAIILAYFPWVCHTFRIQLWTTLLKQPIGWWDTFKIVMATDLGSSISPTAVGGAPLKWAMLIDQGYKPGLAATLVALASVEEGAFFLVAMPAMLYFSGTFETEIFRAVLDMAQLWLTIGLFIALPLTAGVWGIIKFRILKRGHERKYIGGFIRGIEKTGGKISLAWLDFKWVFHLIWRRGKLRFAASFILNGLQWFSRYSIITALAFGLGFSVNPVKIFVLQWFVYVSMVFIPTPGATGGAEAASYFIFKSIIPHEMIGLIVAGWRFLSYYLILMTAAVLLYFGTIKKSRLK